MDQHSDQRHHVLRGDHPLLAEAPLRSHSSHLVGLRESCDLVLQAEGGSDGAATVARHLQAARERPLSAASLSSADPSLSRSSSSQIICLHELPAVARTTEGLRPVPGVRPVRPAEQHTQTINIEITNQYQDHSKKLLYKNT